MQKTDLRLPEQFHDIDEVMSNFDHTVEPGAEQRLREEECFGGYSGWNFHGYVWFDRESQQFACEIWQYNAYRQTILADTLEVLMENCCDEYGRA